MDFVGITHGLWFGCEDGALVEYDDVGLWRLAVSERGGGRGEY